MQSDSLARPPSLAKLLYLCQWDSKTTGVVAESESKGVVTVVVPKLASLSPPPPTGTKQVGRLRTATCV